jgi:periplasmic protein TonB
MSIQAPLPAPPAPPAPAADYGPSEDQSYRRYRPPRYPPQALRRREEGEVILRVLVGTDGKPVQIEIEKSSRSRLLDRAAIDAVQEWLFNPGVRNGQPVQGWVLVPISFRLSDA